MAQKNKNNQTQAGYVTIGGLLDHNLATMVEAIDTLNKLVKRLYAANGLNYQNHLKEVKKEPLSNINKELKNT
jgi:hypothetical protein